MTRTRKTLTLTALGLTGVFAAAAVGAAVATPADAADETHALAALDSDEPGTRPGRAYLRKNTLHGEVVVNGRNGTRTIVVQRGTVTASDDRTLSVKSSDGFTLSWTKGDKLTVRGTLKTGAEVGVAGAEEGDATVARLVRVKP